MSGEESSCFETVGGNRPGVQKEFGVCTEKAVI